MERDIAAADQVRGGRRWRFDGWDHGGSASQTLFTPDSDSTYTARFTDLGPAANQPPSVSLTAPASGTVGEVIALGAAAADSDGRVVRVDFYDGDTLIASAASAPYAASWIPVVAGPASLRARAFDDLGASTDSAVAVVTVGAASGDRVAPTATLTTPAPLAAGLAGTLALVAEASDDTGVAAVEFQVDGATVGSELTAPPYRVTIDTALWASGPHLVRVRARDAAGNRSAWSQARVDFGGSRSLPAGFSKDEAFVTGLDAATAMAQAPDGRLFVAEQGGALRVVKAGVLLATAFHRFSVDTQGERGLLGVTLHPQFASNGFIYVYYTRINGAARNNRVARLVAAGDTSTGAEQVLVDLPDLSASVHNGGAMKFGADGKLYVAVGDNADTRKPQDLADPFGKMLRFNDDGSIPTDNPFFAAASATQAGLARAVWAYGLRNPFTFAIQPGSGRMHINDVGADRWEEINLGAPGANYGWPGSEGLENLGAGITPPLFTYGHLPGTPPGAGPGGFFVGFAVAGGAFYPANGPFPLPYRGNYFFADYVGRFIGLIDLANGNAAYSFGSVEGLPVDMLVGTDGALHVLTRSGITRISSP
jgi:glucose/arabinose dehydrogenase